MEKKKAPKRQSDADEALARKILARQDQLKGRRYMWESHWQECTDYVIPRKSDIQRNTVPGSKKGIELYDSSAAQACELLAGALHGMLTNPSTQWFDLTTGDQTIDDDDQVRRWLEDTTWKMHQVFNNSNFQTEVHEIYIDQCSVGTAALAIEEDDEMIVRFGARHIAEIFVSENRLGVVDTVHRVFKFSARNIVDEFEGDGKLTEDILEKAKNAPEDQLEIVHAVAPRRMESVSKDLKGPRAYKFESVYVLRDKGSVLRESGYREFPYAVPRWTRTSGEEYGRSPAMKMLADIKMINEMMKTTLRAAQKLVDPPLMVPDDGFVLPLNTNPAGFNYFRSGTNDKIAPFGNDGRIDFGYQAMEDVRKRIRDGFYVDQLQLQTQGPQMTATEVQQRTEEKLRLLGPMLGRQATEFLAPLIKRTYAIMVRKGVIDIKGIPEKVRNGRLSVQYSSQIARAQRMVDGTNLQRAVSMAAPIVQVNPDAMDIVDADEAMKLIFDICGVPEKVMRDKKKIKDIRAAKAQAMAKAQSQNDQQSTADTISKVAPALAKAKQSGIF